MKAPRSLPLAAWLMLSALRFGVAADTRPNIVFLMADDQATYSMGCYGTPGAKTPNLDALARRGMVFDNHYDTTAICMASRASVMTGMYEYKTGCNFEHGPMHDDIWQQSYPVLLRAAGYQTAFAGKFGFEVAGANMPNKPDLPSEAFDVWGGGPGQTSYQTIQNQSMAHYAREYPHSTLSYGAFGRDFIEQAAQQSTPFCLSISFKAPHQPVQPDPKFDDVYRDVQFTKPKNFGREHGEHLSPQSRAGRQYERFHSWSYSTDYDGVMTKYFQQIYAIDVAVGMIRDALAANDVQDNTIVIYTSDNGFLCGSHGYASKVLPYEEASRVPLIIHDPRSPNSGKGLRCDALTGNVDFAPTILKLAGLAIPQSIDGGDLIKLYDSPESTIHDALPLINVWGPHPTHSLGIVTRDWKYIRWPYENDQFSATEELFYTRGDPLELENLAGAESAAAELQKMRVLYDAQVKHWRSQAVPYNNYQNFAEFFQRAP